MPLDLRNGYLDLPYTPMVWIGPDSFIFQEGENESTQITFQKGFWASCYPVTQAVYEHIMGENPSRFKGKYRPVERVSWDDAHAFLERLNQRVSLADGLAFRLPSEAMWEYAARAKQDLSYSGSEVLAEVGWYHQNSYGQTMPVGLKEPNAFGLYDLSGNVWEWCADTYQDGGSIRETPSDGLPYLLDRIKGKLLRGGSFTADDSGDVGRVGARSRYYRGGLWDDLGFRVFRY